MSRSVRSISLTSYIVLSWTTAVLRVSVWHGGYKWSRGRCDNKGWGGAEGLWR
jgi:hypothetical protein